MNREHKHCKICGNPIYNEIKYSFQMLSDEGNLDYLCYEKSICKNCIMKKSIKELSKD